MTILRLLTLTIALTAILAHSKPRAATDPCGITGDLMPREYQEGLAKVQGTIMYKETASDPELRDYSGALQLRRTIQMNNPACYEWLKMHYGLGRSPLTGE